MSRARHEAGRYKEFGPEHHDEEEKPKLYDAQGSEEAEEAEEGEEGEEGGHRKKRKHGGKLEHEIEGMHGKKRYDRPGRKRGGAVGSNAHPLSSAAHIKNAEDHHADDGNAEDE